MANNSFAQLKRSRGDSFEKLNQELTKLQQNTPGQSGDDNRFWKPEVDKAGNGSAIIRFLPAPPNEDVPFARYWDHGFQGPGGWYIEKSLTTFGEKDPVSEYNTQLWNSGVEANKEQVRKQKRRLHYIANIYVVKDPANPDNEGKVFLYQFGKKIFDKLKDLMEPEFDDEQPTNPFDLWEGANFRLKIRNVEGYRNYDKSEFDNPAPLFDDDDKLEGVWKSEHSLQAFLDRKNFKSYDELKTRLYRVLALDGGSVTQNVQDRFSDSEDEAPRQQKTKPQKSQPVAEDDDDESMQFFKELAED
jgi:hypothetical protein